MILNTIKILVPFALSFTIGILITPLISDFLYKNRLWKKSSVKAAVDGGTASITQSLHQDEAKKTPRMGGAIIWLSVLVTIFVIWIISLAFPSDLSSKLDFLSRNQTWLPLFTLIIASLVGLLDDYLVVREGGSYAGGGLSLKTRLLAVFILSIIGAWWFFFKLEVSSIFIPFLGDINLGLFFIPLFIFFMIGMYSGGVIDGIDGLAGGIFSIIYASYAVIAFSNNQIDLAAFCMVVAGGLLAFLWFNIPPARFYLSETGTMGLTTTLVVIAFLTKAVAVLPIIAILPIVTALSSLIQVVSKKFRGGKRVFVVAPLHNHFQAIGWPPYKVTMRYWVLGVFFAVIGVIVSLIG
jgi:phospho-N-acetylmuramoyl-pentapeptide-transferase